MENWWKERVVYQIYPRSFQDTNGDGIGDIPGIIMHLEELKDLGVGILWISPVYSSPNADNGYDISDYRAIHKDYGTMENMEQLIKEANKLDIKIVMDLVINHTSDEHDWFQKSRENIEPYKDYYIWRPAKKGKLPNNWTSFFAEDCWEFDENRQEYYLHLFAKKQPDLNYNNPKVLEEVKDIMRFWLDKGVSGFRCDVINVLYKSSLEDGKKKLILTGSEFYISQEGNHKILQELRKDVLDHYDCFTVGETVFVTPEMGRDLCDEDRCELNMIFSFEHMEADQWKVKWFNRKFNLKKFATSIEKWQKALEWNANYIENHDQRRVVSRFGDDGEYWDRSAKMLSTMLLSLRGTPYIFQGQEIGMTNFDFTSMDQVQDVESHNVNELLKRFHIPEGYRWKMIKTSSRDNCRTPMQWKNGPEAGFTTGKPWLGVNKNYTRINMAAQVDDPDSIRSYYKKMIKLRDESMILKYGEFEALEISKNIFVYKRTYENNSLTILLNFSKMSCKANFNGNVIISNTKRTDYDGVLQPYEAIILK
ncbi:glycoside hydrolase family 13 protein [Clostridium sp. DL1XJH146]